MARKAIVDRDIVLICLREGKTTQYIAEQFGVNRQAIDLHRRDFISRGLLPNQRAARGKRAALPALPRAVYTSHGSSAYYSMEVRRYG